MAVTIPMIITNSNILVCDKAESEFKEFSMAGETEQPNIPFYHTYASKIAECQHYFKEFIKTVHTGKLSKNILAIIIPDDTSPLEKIFINEFFLHSGTCKGVAQMTMGQALSKDVEAYISISKSSRNLVLQYIRNNDVLATKFYDVNNYDIERVKLDTRRIHIDVEYQNVPIYVNNFGLNMDDFFSFGEIITPKQFMDKIAKIDVEKI